MTQNYVQQILALAQKGSLLRAKDIHAQGIPNTYLGRMVDQGLLEQVGRGLYKFSHAPITEHHSLAMACARAPNGIVCLLSALNFYGLTTQLPFEVWLAIENKAWATKEELLPIRLVRFSGAAFTEGIQEHTIEGISVKMYDPAKTIADCFKFRNKIGLDVALEALRDGVRHRLFTIDQLWYYAGICRVQNIMRPYLEAIL